jgi:hypothetical protein
VASAALLGADMSIFTDMSAVGPSATWRDVRVESEMRAITDISAGHLAGIRGLPLQPDQCRWPASGEGYQTLRYGEPRRFETIPYSQAGSASGRLSGHPPRTAGA